ncbi:hypothetical protein HMPREF0880_03326 [Yokenella regensburgei ATCC 43003]|nr:hypothetical protein HMPREF0880_03326 [Yokenella regensburgei ATCC 43003]
MRAEWVLTEEVLSNASTDCAVFILELVITYGYNYIPPYFVGCNRIILFYQFDLAIVEEIMIVYVYQMGFYRSF